MDATLASHLAAFRDLRKQLESNVLPLAGSVDGRRFEFQASLESLDFRVGGYVVIASEGRSQLGQILGLGASQIDAGDVRWSGETSLTSRVVVRHARGEGVLLEGPSEPFHDASVRSAKPEEVRAWAASAARDRARIEVGELALAPGVTHSLDAGGFDRHTFLCGQSGSGKTYALGVLLERLLLETSLRMVVLDPNSDYARIRDARDGAEPALAARLAQAATGVRVHRSDATGGERLRLRFAELGTAGAAAALHLDPVRDREEYSELAAVLDDAQPEVVEEIFRSKRPGAAALALRARNLGIDTWGIWARGDAGSSLDALDDPAVRCLVVDLGSLPTRAEQALMGEAVLDRLWKRRALREPILIVIDEAHNVCPADPSEPLTALTTEYGVRIAAEGRKFGLYLLTATQRPQKIHPNIVSQSDNVVLMRMNSSTDLAYTRDMLSFVPSGLLEQAPHVPAGRGARGRQAVIPPGARTRRPAHRAGGRRRRALDLGRAPLMRVGVRTGRTPTRAFRRPRRRAGRPPRAGS